MVAMAVLAAEAAATLKANDANGGDGSDGGNGVSSFLVDKFIHGPRTNILIHHCVSQPHSTSETRD